MLIVVYLAGKVTVLDHFHGPREGVLKIDRAIVHQVQEGSVMMNLGHDELGYR